MASRVAGATATDAAAPSTVVPPNLVSGEMRKRKLTGVVLMIGAAALTLIGLVARRNAKPPFYAQAFPTMNGQLVDDETKALISALKTQGIPIRPEWPSRFTYGRGAGPGIPPEAGPVLVGIGFVIGAYTQGFIGQIGAEHSIAIRRAIKEWLDRRKDDEFYFAIETVSGQQVRARCKNAASFTEAYDALDDALKQLPELPPNGFCLIEWDEDRHQWVQPL